MDHSKLKTLPPLERLIYWIRVRENVRLLKEDGEPPPWTDDPILRSYRFCNVRRMDDRVSRWLLEHWYTPHHGHRNTLYAAGLARLFNLPDTLTRLTRWVYTKKGGPDWAKIEKEAKARRVEGHPLYNAAYIVSTSGRSIDKVDAVLEYTRGLGVVEVDTRSMEKTHGRISGVCYGYKSFMAGQVVADLRHALPGEWADRHSWAPVGPGSARGMARLFYRRDEMDLVTRQFRADQDGFLTELRRVIGHLKGVLPASITGRLEAHDYQNCLCEFDKYERTLWGDGKPKRKYPGGA